MALWLSYACALLRPTLGALPVLAHQLGTLFPSLFASSYEPSHLASFVDVLVQLQLQLCVIAQGFIRYYGGGGGGGKSEAQNSPDQLPVCFLVVLIYQINQQML